MRLGSDRLHRRHVLGCGIGIYLCRVEGCLCDVLLLLRTGLDGLDIIPLGFGKVGIGTFVIFLRLLQVGKAFLVSGYLRSQFLEADLIRPAEGLFHLPDGTDQCLLAVMVCVAELVRPRVCLCLLQFRGYQFMEHTAELPEDYAPVYVRLQFLRFHPGKEAVPLHT